METAELVAAALGVPRAVVVDGLREIDRPAMPVLPRSELDLLIRPIFAEPHRPGLGVESGVDALSRFSAAISSQVAQLRGQNLIAITHGTVIALFLGAHNAIDAFDLWRHLECASLVVLEGPTYRLVDIVRDANPPPGAEDSPPRSAPGQ